MTVATDERLISADSHVALEHDAIKGHLPSKYHTDYDEAAAAFTQRVFGSAAGKTNRAKMYQHPAATRAGYHDPVERLKDMDLDGVEVEVLYSEVSGFRYLYQMRDGGTHATRAFNDTMNDFAAVDPKRLVVSYQIPIHDVAFAISEVERVAAAGGKSLQLPVFPSELGLPEYYDHSYDPLWSTIQETGLPICCHIGLNTNLDDLARRDPTPQRGVMVTMTPLSSAEALGMWILTGTLARFPDLKLVFVEPGVGWLAWYLMIIDDMATRQRYDFPELAELPSFYFRRNIHVTFIEEDYAIRLLRDRIGVTNLMWSTDYPHPVCSWPDSRKIAAEQLEGVPADERELILSGNAIRVWNL